jgi:hypothetical protein
MEDAVNVLESTLCDKCSVLRFDDRRLGGYTVQNDHGEEVLRIDHDKYDGTSRQLWLDYIHHDSLPELPYLRASAEAGCAFCAMLRSVTLERNFVDPARATFSLFYKWTNYALIPLRGTCSLSAVLQVGGNGLEPASCRVLEFGVDCEQGDSRPDVLGILS